MIGETIAGYRLVSRIGAGGMGEVYVGEHTRIERKDPAALASPGPRLTSREARLHPVRW